MKTLYDVLELSRQASPEAVEASYQRMARHWRGHGDDPAATEPDRSLRVDAIERAYAILADPQSRRAYDEELKGRQALRGRPSGGHPRGAPSAVRPSLRAPWVWVLMLLAVALVAALAAGYLSSAQRTGSPGYPTPDSQARIRQLELEKELLARRLAFESERLQRQVELAQREQARRERESAHRLDTLDRTQPMQDQLTAIQVQERKADLARRIESDTRDAIRQRVADLNRAAEAVRDLNTARLGISPRQYELLREEQSGW